MRTAAPEQRQDEQVEAMEDALRTVRLTAPCQLTRISIGRTRLQGGSRGVVHRRELVVDRRVPWVGRRRVQMPPLLALNENPVTGALIAACDRRLLLADRCGQRKRTVKTGVARVAHRDGCDVPGILLGHIRTVPGQLARIFQGQDERIRNLIAVRVRRAIDTPNTAKGPERALPVPLLQRGFDVVQVRLRMVFMTAPAQKGTDSENRRDQAKASS